MLKEQFFLIKSHLKMKHRSKVSGTGKSKVSGTTINAAKDFENSKKAYSTELSKELKMQTKANNENICNTVAKAQVVKEKAEKAGLDKVVKQADKIISKFGGQCSTDTK